MKKYYPSNFTVKLLEYLDYRIDYSYLFDSLNLPDLEKKKFKNLLGEKFKRSGYRSKGIKPRLSKRETLKRKIRRQKASEICKDSNIESQEEEERFPEEQIEEFLEVIQNKIEACDIKFNKYVTLLNVKDWPQFD